jgi:protocatechuate 3,4-dioxygenase alpha subunit
VAGLTPYQTVGPFFDFGLAVAGTASIAGEATEGQRITVTGIVRDGAGQPVPDALIEIWQANAAGHYAHPADPRATSEEASFRGFGRCATDNDGRFAFETIVPGRVPFDSREETDRSLRAGPSFDSREETDRSLRAGLSGERGLQAPHLAVGVLARGVQTRLVTRIYFEDQPSNDEDPVLRRVPPDRRQTLIARRAASDRYEFDIRLQGENETVFFDV